MTGTNTSLMAEEDDPILDFHDQSPAQGLPWLPTCILDDDGIEPCAESGEADYRLFSKRSSVINDGLEGCGEDDGIEPCAESGEADYRLFSKRSSVINDGLEGCGEDDDRRFYFTDRNYNYKHRHQPSSGRKSSVAALVPSPPHWKNYSKPDQKTKYPTNWATGGPGMQAVFLASGQRSCGTGVFLPRTAGTDAEKPKKPAFAPILLPSRVVQALNLNIHGLGLQIKPRQHNNNVKGLECDQIRTKKSRDISSQTCVISQNRSSSPEIFLPKEWTY